jgi:hypothetical protein
MIALLDGEAVALWGLQFMPGIPPMAFAELTPDALCHPFAVHRQAIRFLKGCGYDKLLAYAEDIPAAVPWLQRLGFRAIGETWVWKKEA